MRLFEGGILDKITNDEYEKMFQKQTTAVNAIQVDDDNESDSDGDDGIATISDNEESNKIDGKGKKELSEKELKALSLQMLQGAFYLLILGYLMAFLAFIAEIGCHRMGKSLQINCRSLIYQLRRQFHQLRMKINQLLWILKDFLIHFHEFSLFTAR